MLESTSARGRRTVLERHGTHREGVVGTKCGHGPRITYTEKQPSDKYCLCHSSLIQKFLLRKKLLSDTISSRIDFVTWDFTGKLDVHHFRQFTSALETRNELQIQGDMDGIATGGCLDSSTCKQGCGGSNENGPHRLIDLNAWSTVGWTIWKRLGGVSPGVGSEVSSKPFPVSTHAPTPSYVFVAQV